MSHLVCLAIVGKVVEFMNRRLQSSSPAVQNFSVPALLTQARAHWAAGKPEQAEVLCQRVLALWPGQADALHLLGVIVYTRGNLDLAILHLRQACKFSQAPAAYLSNFSEMCRQRGLLAEGEQAARRAVARDAAYAGGWNNLGIILQESGKFKESHGCLERALKLQPNFAEAHNNLGNTCKWLRLISRAEHHWQRALALKPDYAEPHSNLAKLLSEQEQYERAIEHGRRAIALKPNLAEAYINLAGVETAKQNYGEALRWLERLLTFAPAHAVGLAARAVALKRLDRVEEAMESAQRALRAAPERQETLNAYGAVQQEMGNIDAALAAYERAITLPGTGTEELLINRAVLLMEHGRTAEAERASVATVTTYPDSAIGWFNRASLKKFSADDPEIQTMHALLAQDGNTSQVARRFLHFALGKAYMDIGDADLAFKHLNEGNRLKRAGSDYDPDATSRWMEAVGNIFTPEFLQRLSGQGASSAQPVFVLGMPRSGTTLVEQILASHPSIHGAGELQYIQKIVTGIPDFLRTFGSVTPEQLRQLGQAYLDKVIPLAKGRPHIVDKMPVNFVYAGLIHLILPDARIIHCRRDPVDTCLSCYSKSFSVGQLFSYDQTELGRYYNDYQKIMEHWREVLPTTHFLEVDYESVIDDLEGQARRMLAFLGLEWDPACLTFYKTERPVRTASVNQVRQPVYSSSAGRWRKYGDQLQPLLAALDTSKSRLPRAG